jgi:hypothetical protein
MFPGLMKQELIEFNRQINGPDMELITIKYYMRRPGVTTDKWEKTDGVVWQYNEVPALKETISELVLSDNPTVNTGYGKTNFRFPYIGYDFHGNTKKYFEIIDLMGRSYPIDLIFPQVRIGNRWLNWCGMQK